MRPGNRRRRQALALAATAAWGLAAGGCLFRLLGKAPEPADNSYCYVCHTNYEVEEFAITHAAGDIGCEDCHGSSDAHCSDEDNITPPDTMFPREKIKAACMHCHPHPSPANHKDILAGTAKGKVNCADCHAASHRLEHRTRRWNKATGELIEDDDVRMMTDEMLQE